MTTEARLGDTLELIFKVATGTMGAVFLYAAVVQWNDPEPLRWIALYASAAVIAILPIFHPVFPTPCLALAMVSIGWALSLVPSLFQQLAFTGTEAERDFAGLSLVGFWMLLLNARATRERRIALAKRRELDARNAPPDEARKQRAK